MSMNAEVEKEMRSVEGRVGERLAAMEGEEVGEDPDLEFFQQSLRNREHLYRQWGREMTTYDIQEIEFQFRECVGNRYAYSEQTSSVDKYHMEFCEWKRWMCILYGWEDPKEVVVGIFIRGLKKSIRNEMPFPFPFPTSLNCAYLEAITIELSMKRMDPLLEKKSNGVDPNPVQDVAVLDRKLQMYSVKVKEEDQIKKSKFEKVGDMEEVLKRVEDSFGNKVLLEDPDFDKVNWVLKCSSVTKCNEIGLQDTFNDVNVTKESQNLIIVLNTLDDCYDWCLRSEIRIFVRNGILFVPKDPENIKDLTFRDFVNLLKEESDVSEEILVRNVLYACQGVDGKHVRFNKNVDGDMLNDFTNVPRVTRVMVRQLCELVWLFKKVKSYYSESIDRFPSKDVRTIDQTIYVALQAELSEYYKLLVVLELQSMILIPSFLEAASLESYFSLRRLSVWVAKPMVEMRVMVVLGDIWRVLSGRAMIDANHLNAQHENPLVHEFMRSLLRLVCSPLFELARSWALEGELEDIFSEIFILGQPVKVESLWREDHVRVDAATEAAAAAGTTTGRGGLGYGEIDALDTLLSDAAKTIDKQLLVVIYKQYRFKEHCFAIERYILLGQGDFVQYLMKSVGLELSEPASIMVTFKLAGIMESAIQSLSAQYDDKDILDSLRIKLMPYETGERGWDVFSLEDDTRVPLDTVFTKSIMSRYLRVFNCIWKLRHVRHALIGARKTMKPNCITSHDFSKLQCVEKMQLFSALSRCQVLWDEMNHFLSNLQYCMRFEVLEASWSSFSAEKEVAQGLDELLTTHKRFRSRVDTLYEGINDLKARKGIKEDSHVTGYNHTSQTPSAINFPIYNSVVSVSGFLFGSTSGLSTPASKETVHEESNSEMKGSQSNASSYDISNKFQHQKSQNLELQREGLSFDAYQDIGSLHGSTNVLPSVKVQQ